MFFQAVLGSYVIYVRPCKETRGARQVGGSVRAPGWPGGSEAAEAPVHNTSGFEPAGNDIAHFKLLAQYRNATHCHADCTWKKAPSRLLHQPPLDKTHKLATSAFEGSVWLSAHDTSRSALTVVVVILSRTEQLAT